MPRQEVVGDSLPEFEERMLCKLLLCSSHSILGPDRPDGACDDSEGSRECGGKKAKRRVTVAVARKRAFFR